MEQQVLPVGKQQAKRWMEILRAYHGGLAPTKGRIVASENWWKLRNTREEGKLSALGRDGGFTAVSGWLHNVIVSKHSDAMADYPEPVLLPREQADQQEARTLSAVIPCVLEHNHFESTYSDVMWQKMKFGTGVYKVVWDSAMLGGLGDIRVEKGNLLNLYWQPGVTDIQRSKYLFQTELTDRETLQELYPDREFPGSTFSQARFLYDDTVSTADKITVVEVYYRKNGLLHYAKFAGEEILFATENDPNLCARGLYDHARYPYVFDPLFPMEGSPCGYGYVDVCRNPQTQIDLLRTSFVRNAMVGSTPRYFARSDGKVNEAEFLDLSNPIVHVAGTLDETALRQVGHCSLDGNYVQMLRDTIDELRETSGNTETSTGNISSGVTAASAIAALQEASGKGSRDSTRGSYRSFRDVVELCVELVRQFYDLPRQFRILGPGGVTEFLSYDNRHLAPQHQGVDFGVDMGFRKPVFDIRVEAQRKSAYARLSQNELATQFFQLGFFDPARAQQALACMEMMDFEGKEQVMARIARGAAEFAPVQPQALVSLTPPEDPRMGLARAGAEGGA